MAILGLGFVLLRNFRIARFLSDSFLQPHTREELKPFWLSWVRTWPAGLARKHSFHYAIAFRARKSRLVFFRIRFEPFSADWSSVLTTADETSQSLRRCFFLIRFCQNQNQEILFIRMKILVFFTSKPVDGVFGVGQNFLFRIPSWFPPHHCKAGGSGFKSRYTFVLNEMKKNGLT